MARKRQPTLAELQKQAYETCTLGDFREIVWKANSRDVKPETLLTAVLMLMDLAMNGPAIDWAGIWNLLEHKCPMFEGERQEAKRKKKKTRAAARS